MKMVAGLVVVLVSAFALPSAFASSETKDFITRGAYENLVKSGAIESITMTKTIISSPILEESFETKDFITRGAYEKALLEAALVTFPKKGLGGRPTCGETCFQEACYTPGCSCNWPVCERNALALPSAFASSETKDFITRDAYENLVKSGAIESITMTKTIISSPILEESFETKDFITRGAYEKALLEAALVTFPKKGLGGRPTCGETCFQEACYTPGCSCNWPVCERNALAI